MLLFAAVFMEFVAFVLMVGHCVDSSVWMTGRFIQTMTQGSSQNPKFSGDTAFDADGGASCSVYVASSVWPSQVWVDIWLRLDQVTPVHGCSAECHAPHSPLRFISCTYLAERELLKIYSSDFCDLSLAPSMIGQCLSNVIRSRILR